MAETIYRRAGTAGSALRADSWWKPQIGWFYVGPSHYPSLCSVATAFDVHVCPDAVWRHFMQVEADRGADGHYRAYALDANDHILDRRDFEADKSSAAMKEARQ
jgi:hypothetical protein